MAGYSVYYAGHRPGQKGGTVRCGAARKLECPLALVDRLDRHSLTCCCTLPGRHASRTPVVIWNLHHWFVSFRVRTARRRAVRSGSSAGAWPSAPAPCCDRSNEALDVFFTIRHDSAVHRRKNKTPGSFADPGEPCCLVGVTMLRHLD